MLISLFSSPVCLSVRPLAQLPSIFTHCLLYVVVRFSIPPSFICPSGRPSVCPTYLILLLTSRLFFSSVLFCQSLPSSVTRLLVSLSVNNSVSYCLSVQSSLLLSLTPSFYSITLINHSSVRQSVILCLSDLPRQPLFNPSVSYSVVCLSTSPLYSSVQPESK